MKLTRDFYLLDIEGVGAIEYKHVKEIIALVESPDQLVSRSPSNGFQKNSARIAQLSACEIMPLNRPCNPFLWSLTSPKFKHHIERNSPEIIGHDGAVWIKMLRRDIKSYMDDPVEPKDGKDWNGLYQVRTHTKHNSSVRDKRGSLLFDDRNSKKSSGCRLQPLGPGCRPDSINTRPPRTSTPLCSKKATGSTRQWHKGVIKIARNPWDEGLLPFSTGSLGAKVGPKPDTDFS